MLLISVSAFRVYFHGSLYLLIQVREGNEASKMRGHIGDYTLVTTLPVLLLSSGSVLFTKASVFVTIELQSLPQYSKRSQLRLLLQYFALKRGPKHKELVIRKRVNYKGTMFLRQRKQVHVK